MDDVLAYLIAAFDLPPGESRIFEIGCTDVTTYGDIIREYARQKGLRRWLIFVPVLTPYLSSLWLALVTPASFEVGRHLIEGLKNPTVVSDRSSTCSRSGRWEFVRRWPRPWHRPEFRCFATASVTPLLVSCPPSFSTATSFALASTSTVIFSHASIPGSPSRR